MSTRRLGNSDLNITPVGFGAWAIGGIGYDFAWGKQDDADSIAAIHRSLELGVNWIDTAPVYGTGHSEEIVASALKEWRGSRPYVFTKCVMRWDEKGRVTTVFNRDSIRRECDDSLRRLQVDVIDLYQMHWPPADNGPGLEEAWQTMAGLQKEGKVRWIGISNFNVAQIERAEKIAPVISLQPSYSLIHRQIETETLPYCEKQGIGVIVYSPMTSGLLTGAMMRETRCKASRRRLAEAQRGVPRTQSLKQSQTRRSAEKSCRTLWTPSRRGRHRLDAAIARRHRRHRWCAQRQASRRRDACRRTRTHPAGHRRNRRSGYQTVTPR